MRSAAFDEGAQGISRASAIGGGRPETTARNTSLHKFVSKRMVMKRSAKYVFSAVCVVGLVGTVSRVRSQGPSAPSEQVALVDLNQAPPTAPQPDAAVPPPAGAATDKIVQQTRGPLNQGFAEMTNMTPQPAPPVAKRPPAPIDEQPPDVK